MGDQTLTFTMGWAECLPVLLMVRENADLPERRNWADDELHRMAVVADKAAAALAKLNAAAPARIANTRGLSAAERSTLMAALTHYRRSGMGEAERRDALIDSVATSSGLFLALDNAGIEALTAIIANATGLEI
ncbi:hypothetical protein [Cereibacter changlensis]|uniref:hypothetical protein n=1 Tax=Cereibacter changlensis TaxID=402884 RepID=UPI004033A87C